MLATEIDKNSLQGAEACAKEAQLENISFKKCRAETMDFNELSGGYDFSTLLLDPPRAGLDAAARDMSARCDHVIYVSCNAQTLARDLALMKSMKCRRHAYSISFPGLITPKSRCG